MKKSFLYFSILTTLFILSCKEEVNSDFIVASDQIGKLNKSSLSRDVELIFAKDSVVQDTVKLSFGSGASKIKVFENGGKLLLTLTPNVDSIATIQNVQINDARYKTEKGITINSTFQDIKDNYEIKKIITSLNNVVILLKNSDLYFTIDKKELPEDLRYKTNTNIEEVNIPEKAKIKYMMIGWD